jgi:hypothetical protein
VRLSVSMSVPYYFFIPWPLLTVETEVNDDSKSTNEYKWPVRWACHAGTRDFCPVLAALVSPVQNIISPQRTLFQSFVPIAQQAGQSVEQGRQSLRMCLWSNPKTLSPPFHHRSVDHSVECSHVRTYKCEPDSTNSTQKSPLPKF